MAIDVRVCLNQSEDNFFGYQPGAPLSEVVAFALSEELVGEIAGGIPARALELVFDELNVDDPTTEWALRYRLDRNRSISVGDVVIVGDKAYAVERMGWQPVSLVADQITRLPNASHAG
ncbi:MULTISPECIES: hypothetical protein [Mycolicibacter]|uniref:Uncharacterized protein n=2 Tax=Mycolicibacter TaxID=1073531 RepID=A0ABU5XN54_9MYCO|nr:MULTISPECIES: hypothetical protein [unclassified Mycolicibacter]MEB3023414.1 hypothetical protein [Mycolicibacter sp. MYC098]MEB3033756.1 hypothetical protein [Mycolicibacter sp. MYC340]